MSKINIDLVDENDEIGLEQIFKFFFDHWREIPSWSILGASLGWGYGFISNPIFEATGNIQTAKVANVELESPALLLTKLAMPTYYSEDTLVACGLFN